MSSYLMTLLFLLYLFSSLECTTEMQDSILKWKAQDVWNDSTSIEMRSENIAGQGRTFGLRRLKMAIPLIMFKLGVMVTLMGFLTLIALKTLVIAVILLVSHLSGFLAKLHFLKHAHGEEKGPAQDIHVHVHQDHAHHSGPDHPGPYSGWDKVDSTTEYKFNLNRLKYLNSLYQQDM